MFPFCRHAGRRRPCTTPGRRSGSGGGTRPKTCATSTDCLPTIALGPPIPGSSFAACVMIHAHAKSWTSDSQSRAGPSQGFLSTRSRRACGPTPPRTLTGSRGQARAPWAWPLLLACKATSTTLDCQALLIFASSAIPQAPRPWVFWQRTSSGILPGSASVYR